MQDIYDISNLLNDEEPDEELDMYGELMQEQFMAEGRNLRKIIEPLICNGLFPFEESCLGTDILVIYQEQRLPSHLAAQVQEHLVCCQLCAEDMLFLTDSFLTAQGR